MTWSDVVALITGAGPAHLATANDEGEPHVSKVAPVVDGDSVLFATRRKSGKARNFEGNPRVSLMWSGNNAETHLWADVESIDDLATRERMWTSGVFPYDPESFFGAFDNPDVLLVRLRPKRAVAMVAGANGLERRVWVDGPRQP